MSRELVVIVNPFDHLNWMEVYENGEATGEYVNAVFPDIADVALAFSKNQGIEKILVRGPVAFGSKIQEQIAEKETAQYGASNIQVELV